MGVAAQAERHGEVSVALEQLVLSHRVGEELRASSCRTSKALTALAAGHRRPLGWAGAKPLLTSPGGGPLQPWRLERAIRTARGKVEGIPDGFQ